MFEEKEEKDLWFELPRADTKSEGKEKELCLALLHANTEDAVVQILKEAGYWDKPRMWRDLGDDPSNWSTAGNQQSNAHKAVVEKLVNSVDAMLLREARLEGYIPKTGAESKGDSSLTLPETPAEAKALFFGEEWKDLKKFPAFSRQIMVVATGNRPGKKGMYPCFTITDAGEGQIPADMPRTILAGRGNNKTKIKFVQGKFHMGGTGALAFCSPKWNLQLVISKRHPELLPEENGRADDSHWSFSIVRRDPPNDERRTSCFKYLAPVGVGKEREDFKGELLHFESDTLPIFPDGKDPYGHEAKWGTSIKLYEYTSKRFDQKISLKGGLKRRAGAFLTDVAVPIHFHDYRYPTEGRKHKGGFSAILSGLVKSLEDDEAQKKIEDSWNEKDVFEVDGQKFNLRVYLFKPGEEWNPAHTYFEKEGLLLSYNGQVHHTEKESFFGRRALKLDPLDKSLRVIVDCSKISNEYHEKLFLGSRDGVTKTDFTQKVFEEIEEYLKNNEKLKRYAKARKQQLRTGLKGADVKDIMEQMMRGFPEIRKFLNEGTRISNLTPPKEEKPPVRFDGEIFPTFFCMLKNKRQPNKRFCHLEKKGVAINKRPWIDFHTDVENEYFSREEDRGTFELYQIKNGKRIDVRDQARPSLHAGFGVLRFSLPEGVKVGDKLEFEAVIRDPSKIEGGIEGGEFKNTFVLNVLEKSVASKKINPDTPPNLSGLDFPKVHEVEKKDWERWDPSFDRFTALGRIVESEDEGKTIYEYYLNTDNVHHQNHLEKFNSFAARDREKKLYKTGMAFVAMAMVYYDQQCEEEREKDNTRRDAPKTDEKDPPSLGDRIAQTTAALALFFPLLMDGLSSIEGGIVEDSEDEE